jgi:hypothetical protein
VKTLRYDRDRQIKFKSITSATTPSTTNLLVSSESDDNDKLRRKIKNAADGLPSASECFNYLYNRVLSACWVNALDTCDYMPSLKSEISTSDGYRKNTIILLCTFLIFFKNTKLFKEMTMEDKLSFVHWPYIRS